MAFLLGQRRPEVVRCSLLAAPVDPYRGGGKFLGAMDLAGTQDAVPSSDASFARGLAFISAHAAIDGLMVWLRRASSTTTVTYRLVLAAVLAVILALGWLPSWLSARFVELDDVGLFGSLAGRDDDLRISNTGA